MHENCNQLQNRRPNNDAASKQGYAALKDTEHNKRRQRANEWLQCTEKVAAVLEALTFGGGASIDILLLSCTHTRARARMRCMYVYLYFWHFYFCCHSHFRCANQGCESFLSHFSTSNVVLPKVAHSPFSQHEKPRAGRRRIGRCCCCILHGAAP